MTYYGAQDVADAFRTVRRNTLTIAREIPEESYGYSPVEGWRTVAQLLAHIAYAPSFQEQVHFVEKRSTMAGFDFPSLMKRVMEQSSQSRTKAQIIALLEEEGEKFANQVESLSEETLGQVVTMPPGGSPPSRTRFDMLASVKEHEMHHRGQLMLIERLIGITPHLTRERDARMAAMASAAKS